MRWVLIATLALTGCANLPDTLHPATSAETRAVGAVLAAWGASRREVPACPVLDDVRIYTGPQADVASWCARDGAEWLDACGWTAQRHPFDRTGVATIYVRAPGHCDVEVWGPILRDAARRLEGPR